jgi:hypothetical protein
MDSRQVAGLLNLKRISDKSGCKKYELHLGEIPTGLNAVIKQTGSFYTCELGFGFMYHGGAWVVKRPVLVWSGSTYQEPYQTKLGFGRPDVEVWHLGACKNVRDAQDKIILAALEPTYQIALFSEMATQIEAYTAKVELMNMTFDILKQHLWRGVNE